MNAIKQFNWEWTTEASVEYWHQELIKAKDSVKKMKELSDRWNPYEYSKEDIKRMIRLCVPEEAHDLVTIDYGSYAGKWTRELMDISSKVICVDLHKESKKCIEKRHADYCKNSKCSLEYYVTNGDELFSIDSGSVDFIFSMDSLVRAPSKVLQNLSSEFYRVLKPGGFCLINLHREYIRINGPENRKQYPEFMFPTNSKMYWSEKYSKQVKDLNPRTTVMGPNKTLSSFLILKK